MNEILAYHNDENLKAMLCAEMLDHKRRHRIQQGEWFDDKKDRGCHIGCCGKTLGFPSGTSNFEEISERLGWPLWFTMLQEEIFEGLELKSGIEFSTEICQRIPTGKNLELIRPYIEALRLERLISLQEKSNHEDEEELLKVLGDCRKLWLNGGTQAEWLSAWLAAREEQGAATKTDLAARAASWAVASKLAWTEDREADWASSAASWAASALGCEEAWEQEKETIYEALEMLKNDQLKPVELIKQ